MQLSAPFSEALRVPPPRGEPGGGRKVVLRVAVAYHGAWEAFVQSGSTMEQSAPSAGRNVWLKDANSFLFSAVCHLVALILLGLITVAAGRGWQGVELVARVTDGNELAGAVPLDPIHLEAAPADSTAAGPERLFATTPTAISAMAPIESLFSVSDTPGGLAGGGVGELGDGMTGHVGDATEFFGLGGYGNSFVYVVDCSDSMNEARKFTRARYELLQSIEQLGDSQRYFVIFYNDNAYPMDADEPIQATQGHIEATRRWVSYVVPDGGTNPLPALLYALSLQPDAIYFLSDGRFDPNTITQLRAKNHGRTGRVPIHTISFVNRETQGMMRTIARQSGGKFRFVP